MIKLNIKNYVGFMNSKELKRVVFYSKEDMSAGHNLKNAEELLRSFSLEKHADINDFLELYNVKLYFDNNLFLLLFGRRQNCYR